MKHVYTDTGVIDFQVDTELLNKVVPLITGHTRNDRSMFLESMSKMAYDYSIHSSVGGMGGCLTLEEWESTRQQCQLDDLTKDMLYEAVSREYLPQEAILIVWQYVVQAQLNMALATD